MLSHQENKYSLKFHFKPHKGWMNDPNGLIEFDGYYHAFYQYCPNHEYPWAEPMTWGHARTKDFLNWEELPIALSADAPYDKDGCWSGTAIEKDGELWLYYASVIHNADGTWTQTISVATSKDGIHFEKYAKNPIIREIPKEGSIDFRDPAILFWNGRYYLVIASGNPAKKMARLLLYESKDGLSWTYKNVMMEVPNAKVYECPSFLHYGDRFLLTASVKDFDGHYFVAYLGDFDGTHFTISHVGSVQKGPDQYAGQTFNDKHGRAILMSWVPGWRFDHFAEKNLGCLSLPMELKFVDGILTAFPVQEVKHLLKDSDPCITTTESGFVVERQYRMDIVKEEPYQRLDVLHDNYITEVFVDGGKEVFAFVNC